ncbi:YciI family protein [Streptomyces sp. 8N616]|uniref:YciI family protein n=1 Tax=Streptomyces sp. 8N616 TaxID=3457414 RepID=UPI003FD3386C
MRFMMMVRIDENAAPEGGPSPELMEEMGKLIEEMTKAGVLLDTAGLRPTSEATRVHWDHGKESVIDGPFTETKEVIGGYAIVQAKSKDEAVEWAKRFVRIHGEDWEITSEVRQIEEPEG